MKTMHVRVRPTDEESKGPALFRWVQRFGVLGFAFFFIKGLLWLAVPALLAYLGSR
jgi:hypothetical protein